MDFSRERLFVARWRRILIPWRANTEAEAVRDMEHSCIATLLCVFLFVGFSEFDSARLALVSAIWKTYSAISPELGRRFGRSTRERIVKIAERPEIYPRVDGEIRRTIMSDFLIHLPLPQHRSA